MFVLLFKNVLAQSNAYANIRIIACLLFYFLNRQYVSYSAQYILTKYWQEYYTLCLDVIAETKVACANFDEVARIFAEKVTKEREVINLSF